MPAFNQRLATRVAIAPATALLITATIHALVPICASIGPSCSAGSLEGASGQPKATLDFSAMNPGDSFGRHVIRDDRKSDILKYLEKYKAISAKTLFPDIVPGSVASGRA